MMNRPPQGRGQPGLGATWYPGGQDDFYMPEVISPSPRRCDSPDVITDTRTIRRWMLLIKLSGSCPRYRRICRITLLTLNTKFGNPTAASRLLCSMPIIQHELLLPQPLAKDNPRIMVYQAMNPVPNLLHLTP